jgi:hypothetical protein
MKTETEETKYVVSFRDHHIWEPEIQYWNFDEYDDALLYYWEKIDEEETDRYSDIELLEEKITVTRLTILS